MSSAKYREEKDFGQTAATCLKESWSIQPGGDPPDLIVTMGSLSIGVEVTKVFVGGLTDRGSLRRRNEREREKLIRKTHKDFRAMSSARIAVDLLGAPKSDDATTIASQLFDLLPQISVHRQRFELLDGVIVAYVRTDPSELKRESQWRRVSDRVGFVHAIDSERLQCAIDAKSSDLPRYCKQFDSVDLLIVADTMTNAGRLKLVGKVVVDKRDFRRVVFLSYPDEAQIIA